MTVAKTKLMQAEGLRYERRTFQCPDCANQQTYTMGVTGQYPDGNKAAEA